jgi:hypothetical protein
MRGPFASHTYFSANLFSIEWLNYCYTLARLVGVGLVCRLLRIDFDVVDSRLAPTVMINCMRYRPWQNVTRIILKGPPPSLSVNNTAMVGQPGDALFIPEGWWHQVNSEAGTIAVNFWWSSGITASIGTARPSLLHEGGG